MKMENGLVKKIQRQNLSENSGLAGRQEQLDSRQRCYSFVQFAEPCPQQLSFLQTVCVVTGTAHAQTNNAHTCCL